MAWIFAVHFVSTKLSQVPVWSTSMVKSHAVSLGQPGTVLLSSVLAVVLVNTEVNKGYLLDEW